MQLKAIPVRRPVRRHGVLVRLWKDKVFQFGVCLLLLALLCLSFSLFVPPDRSDLVAITGRIERVDRNMGGGFVPAKLILYVRTPTKLVQVNTKPWVDRDDTLAPGQLIHALVSYEDAFGRDIAFLYELERGSETLLSYQNKVAGEVAFNKGMARLAPWIAGLGVLLCAVRWRRLASVPAGGGTGPPDEVLQPGGARRSS